MLNAMDRISWNWAILAATVALVGCGDDSNGTGPVPDASIPDSGGDAATIVPDATASDATTMDADATLARVDATADGGADATDATGTEPDAATDAAPDAASDSDTGIADAEATDGGGIDAAPPCNSNNCGGACCGDICVSRTCATCDAGAYFCPYFLDLIDSNGTCVSSCLACGNDLEAGLCE